MLKLEYVLSTIGRNIRRLRRAKIPKPSQTELAMQAGLSKNTVLKLENGQVPNIGVAALHGIARALGVKLVDFFSEPRDRHVDFAIAEFRKDAWYKVSKAAPVDDAWLDNLECLDRFGGKITPEVLFHIVTAYRLSRE